MQEESVIKSEVEKYSTPASQAKRRKRKGVLKILESNRFLKQMLR